MDTRERFTFAGFEFPRTVAEFHRGQYNVRRLANGREVRARMRFCYRTAPQPRATGCGFYLESDFMPRLRWQWADEVDGVRINHRGWFCDPCGDSSGGTVRGVVFRLPRSRGFLAGWAMGENMAGGLSYHVHADEADAARAADAEAERIAEAERDAEAERRAAEDAAELEAADGEG